MQACPICSVSFWVIDSVLSARCKGKHFNGPPPLSQRNEYQFFHIGKSQSFTDRNFKHVGSWYTGGTQIAVIVLRSRGQELSNGI